MSVYGRYEVVTKGSLVGMLCRRCSTFVVRVTLDDVGEMTQAGSTLADIIESVDSHEREEHEDEADGARAVEGGVDQ